MFCTDNSGEYSGGGDRGTQQQEPISQVRDSPLPLSMFPAVHTSHGAQAIPQGNGTSQCSGRMT